MSPSPLEMILTSLTKKQFLSIFHTCSSFSRIYFESPKKKKKGKKIMDGKGWKSIMQSKCKTASVILHATFDTLFLSFLHVKAINTVLPPDSYLYLSSQLWWFNIKLDHLKHTYWEIGRKISQSFAFFFFNIDALLFVGVD